MVLDAQQIAEAGWGRDVDALTRGRFEGRDLALVAHTLASLRAPEAVERLAILVNLTEADVREAAAFALGHTPGGAPALRDRLVVEDDEVVRASLFRALGRAGDEADLPLLRQGMAERPRVAVAALQAVAQLASRGVDTTALGDAVVGHLLSPDPRTHPMAAHALWRSRPTLGARQLQSLQRRWRRLADDAAKAQLLRVLLAEDSADPASLVREALSGAAPLTRLAALEVGVAHLTRPELAALAQDDDPWIRARLAPLAPLEGGATRALVAAGGATPDQRTETLEAALDDANPRVRTASAVALLSDPTESERSALATASDPVVRELLCEHYRTHPAGGAAAAVEARSLRTRVACLHAAAAAVAQGWEPPASAWDRWDGWADTGLFPLPQRVARLRVAASQPRRPSPRRRPGAETLAPDAVGATVTTSAGTFRLVLHPERTPLAVAAFVELAERGAYDGLRFHRVLPGVLVQTGDTRGDGMGGADWILPDELTDLPVVRGLVGMARGAADSGGGQWFVTTSAQPGLRGDHTWFAEVSAGFEVVRRLDADDTVEQIRIERVERR